MAFVETYLKSFSSFLLNRNQRVLLNSSSSSWNSVASGVPQGTTMLGPLLFLLYINDITHNIQSSIRLFSDDCILYRHIKSGNDRTVLQQDIHALSLWANTWLIRFNSSKCYILCMNRSKVKPAVNYFLDGQPLSLVDSHTYLGITISSDLHWQNHTSSISAKASRILNFVRHNVYGCSAEAKATAYTTLVRPHLEFSSAAWDLHLAKDVHQPECVQRRAA